MNILSVSLGVWPWAVVVSSANWQNGYIGHQPILNPTELIAELLYLEEVRSPHIDTRTNRNPLETPAQHGVIGDRWAIAASCAANVVGYLAAAVEFWDDVDAGMSDLILGSSVLVV